MRYLMLSFLAALYFACWQPALLLKRTPLHLRPRLISMIKKRPKCASKYKKMCVSKPRFAHAHL